jgi:hypothetical protein
MNDSFELDDLLTGVNPIDETELADPSDSLFARRLFKRVTGSAYQSRRRPVRVRRRWQLSAALALAAVSTGAGVAYALVGNQPTKRLTVLCYREDRIDANAVVVIGSSPDPIAACRAGGLQGGTSGTLPPADRFSACVLPSGVVGVFPSPDPDVDTCRQLNLARAAPTRSRTAATRPTPGLTSTTLLPTGDAMATLIDTIAHGLSPGCVDGGQARVLVEHALKQVGFDSWTVTVRGTFSAARPCASPGFDEPNHEVFLIPIPATG